ncbi:hypothetical protein, partial [Pseudomonas viridiflava]|uniref:hypothetical protein n=1 Tax=Pseudomonas viridiflava TaxID=33069 RepID=UPI0013C2A7F9
MTDGMDGIRPGDSPPPLSMILRANINAIDVRHAGFNVAVKNSRGLMRACFKSFPDIAKEFHMPHEGSLLQAAVVFLFAAVIAAPLAKRLKLGAVIGYLAAGVVIGPSVLG